MLDGKTALVTGAGRGIGRGIALALAAAGAKVVVNDLGASLSGEGKENTPAQTVVDEIVKYGGTAKANYGSVADFGQAAAMVQQAIDSWGRIDIVVHVAGILRDRMIFNMTEDEWDAVINVHLKGMFNVVRAASVSMREQKSGRIISMSSVSRSGRRGSPTTPPRRPGSSGSPGRPRTRWRSTA
jgi:NAD(P)-dependent dehydrogenase (short-subunit alcohol dehydrogenase family)